MAFIAKIRDWFGFPIPEPPPLKKPSPPLVVPALSRAQECERICGQITQSAATIISLMRDDRQKTGQQVVKCRQLVNKLESLLQE